MSKLLLKNGKVYVNNSFANTDVLCINGKISAMGNIDLEDIPRLNCEGLMLVPGFIDVHTHGGVGVDINSASLDDYKKLMKFFASQGTCSFLASVLTDYKQTTNNCLSTIKQAMQINNGAQLLGAHLEGPFLAVQYKGAMPECLLQKPNLDLLNEYLQSGVVRYITISPELEGAIELIEKASKDIVVAIGHSGADYYTACKAIESGAKCVTHTFNAMRLFHQHEPAIMGAALEKNVYCEAICDGLHLHPGSVSMLLKIKGPNKMLAVSDCIMAAGLPDGQYKLGVNDVTVKNGDARLSQGDVRAGSTLTMIRALRNLLKFTNKPIEEILPILTSNPANALNISDFKGSISIGKDADIVILNSDISINSTLCRGNICYKEGESFE